MEKTTLDCQIWKIWLILEPFSRQIVPSHMLNFWRVERFYFHQYTRGEFEANIQTEVVQVTRVLTWYSKSSANMISHNVMFHFGSKLLHTWNNPYTYIHFIINACVYNLANPKKSLANFFGCSHCSPSLFDFQK